MLIGSGSEIASKRQAWKSLSAQKFSFLKLLKANICRNLFQKRSLRLSTADLYALALVEMSNLIPLLDNVY